MPTLKLPRYWLSQLLALLAMVVIWVAMVAYSYTVQTRFGFSDRLGQAVDIATVLWLYPILGAPFIAFGYTPRRLAMAKALSRLTAVVGAVAMGPLFTFLFVSWFVHSASVLTAIAVLIAFSFCAVMITALPAEFESRFRKGLEASQPSPA